jgi:RNA polymerase-associated protein RTF1
MWMAVELFKDLGADLVKPYKINDKTVNQALELRHGKSVRLFNMDKVSNSPFHTV